MNNNLILFNPCQDVFLYFDGPDLQNCVDIDIKDGVDTVVFSGEGSGVIINLRNVNKQFPDVKTILIGKDVAKINISNFMFPNVRKVTSNSKYFCSGRYLVSNVSFLNVLKNVFCIKQGEAVDEVTATIIEDYAFEGCMETNGFFDGITYYRFKEKAFAGSAFLNLPPHNGLISKNGVIFAVDDDATEIAIDDDYSMPEDLNLKHVKKMILYHLNHIASLITAFPETVVIADESAGTKTRCNYGVFNNKRIKNFEVRPDSQSLTVIDGILYSKNGQRLLKCPQGKTGHVSIPEGTRTILSEAFRGCMISSVSLPDSLTEIKDNAFSSSMIQEIDFGHGITSLGNYRSSYVFSRCNSLTRIEIPSHIQTIGTGAFFGCKNLSSVKIHEGVQWIRDSAFNECDSLKSVELPSSIKYIGNGSFLSTETLKVDSVFGGLLYGFTGSYAAGFDVKKLIVKDKTYYLPLVFNPKQLYILNRCCKSSEFPNEQFYKDASCTELKQNTALYLYENHIDDSDEVKKYLKRSSKQIAYRLLDSDMDDKLIQFIQLGLLSKASLNELLLSSREKDNVSISSYILEELDKFSQSTFRL